MWREGEPSLDKGQAASPPDGRHLNRLDLPWTFPDTRHVPFRPTSRSVVRWAVALLLAFIGVAAGWYFLYVYAGEVAEYRNEELGFAFHYPAAWGDVRFTMLRCYPGEPERPENNEFVGQFTNNTQCIFSGSTPPLEFACVTDDIRERQDMDQTSFADLAYPTPGIYPGDRFTNPFRVGLRFFRAEPGGGWLLSGSTTGNLYADAALRHPSFPGILFQCSGSPRGGSRDVSWANQKGFRLLMRTLRYLPGSSNSDQ